MAEVDKLLEAFGIEKREKHVPSRFDPTKHNPLWGEDVHHQCDFDYLTQLNPCPIPVNGKLATTVRFSVEDDGEAAWLRWEQLSKEQAEHLPMYTYEPQPRPKTKNISVDYGEQDMDEVNISCPVLQQFIDEGGQISAADSRKRKTIHLGCNAGGISSLCGAGVRRSLWAAYSGQPDEVGTYQVCSVCRRIAEARFKRKVAKRKPRGPKPPTPEEIARTEQRRKKAAEREEYWRKEDEIVNRKFVDKHLAIIERHYPKVDEATREAAIADLMQLWATDIRGGA